jgi:hypothetical protein
LLIKVNGKSKYDIDAKMEEYLSINMPECVAEPLEIDALKLVDVILDETHGYELHVGDCLDDTIEGSMRPFDREIWFPEKVYSNLVNGDNRARFTACHEAAHVILHTKQIINMGKKAFLSSVAFNREFRSIPPCYNPEWQANYGAGALLMPRITLNPFVRKLLSQGASREDIIFEVKTVYKVSRQAAQTRLVKTGLIKQKSL